VSQIALVIHTAMMNCIIAGLPPVSAPARRRR
jgi:hypothetical protein